MSLSDTVDAFRTGTYRVDRRPTGTMSYGQYSSDPGFDADAVSVDDLTSQIELPGHGLVTGYGELWLSTDDTLPPPLVAGVPYWVIAIDDDHIQLAETRAAALDLDPILLTDIGAGSLHLSTSFDLDASVQPVEGKNLEDMPEGQRADESRLIFTRQELRTRTPANDPDVITIDGDRYRVTKVSKFSIIADHYRCYAERLEVP